MKLVIFIFSSILFISEANAACNFKEIGIGSEYADIKTENKISYHLDDAALPDYFEVQTRARNFCNSLNPRIEATAVFIKGKLARVIMMNFNTEEILKPAALNSFGEDYEKSIANKYGNTDTLKWAEDNKTVIYSKVNNLKKPEDIDTTNWPAETLNITSNDFTVELAENSQKQE